MIMFGQLTHWQQLGMYFQNDREYTILERLDDVLSSLESKRKTESYRIYSIKMVKNSGSVFHNPFVTISFRSVRLFDSGSLASTGL